ncbi:unnamed protein product [Pedinophyceae sp. YPF-701]|nr:unnamed protein product [Pedinophyceae sp. YPF-701]
MKDCVPGPQRHDKPRQRPPAAGAVPSSMSRPSRPCNAPRHRRYVAHFLRPDAKDAQNSRQGRPQPPTGPWRLRSRTGPPLTNQHAPFPAPPGAISHVHALAWSPCRGHTVPSATSCSEPRPTRQSDRPRSRTPSPRSLDDDDEELLSEIARVREKNRQLKAALEELNMMSPQLLREMRSERLAEDGVIAPSQADLQLAGIDPQTGFALYDESRVTPEAVSAVPDSGTMAPPISDLEARAAEAAALIEGSVFDATAAVAAAAQDATSSAVRAKTALSLVFVSAEVAPWSKTGGLGDVVGALPRALAKKGHRTMVVSPLYQNGSSSDKLFEAAKDLGVEKSLDLGTGGAQVVSYKLIRKEDTDFVFVDHPVFRREGSLYGTPQGAYPDNHLRFAILSMAALEAPLVLDLPESGPGGDSRTSRYGQNCVFVANDWHAGLIPVYIHSRFRPYGVYENARTVFAIHNLAYQGVAPPASFGQLGVPSDWYRTLEWIYPGGKAAINVMKAALVTCDRVVTVSQGYAAEIVEPTLGCGMDGIMRNRSRDLNGILNGVDTADWNPETDKFITTQYFLPEERRRALLAATASADPLDEPDTIKAMRGAWKPGKAACKDALQRELGLERDPDAPLIGFIGRLDTQKGPDLVLEAVPDLLGRGCQVVMLGSGDSTYELWMRNMEAQFHDAGFRGWVGFSVPVAHRMFAGCDILLMPSRFEPCGLNQMYAMKYGTVPVVASTGGLRDTVEDFSYFSRAGTGFTFAPCTRTEMMRAVDAALNAYRNWPEDWLDLVERAMAQDYSWERSAESWELALRWAAEGPSHIGSDGPP